MNSKISVVDTNGNGLDLADALMAFDLVKSTEEGKKLIRSGKVFLNNIKIKDVLFSVLGSNLIEIREDSNTTYYRIFIT